MGRKKTQAEWLKEAKQVHGKRYDYSLVVYTVNNVKVKIKCRKHGVFEQLANNHIQGQGCKKCEDERRTRTTAQFIREAKVVHGRTYTYKKTKYVQSTKPVIITCRKHGDFEQKPYHHLDGSGCKLCLWESKGYSHDEYIAICTEVHNGFYSYERTIYTRGEDLVLITCPEHDDFKQQAKVHMYGHGCPQCAAKKTTGPSEGCREWLASIEIPDDDEHREVFIRVPNRRFPYRADGFDPITNTVYEYYGDFYHGNPAVYPDQNKPTGLGKATYGDRYQSTLDRERFLKQAGYNLITIWEKDFMAMKKLAKK